MAVNLFFKHASRKELTAASLSRRNHMVIAHGLLGNCNNWNTSSDMLLRREATVDPTTGALPFVTDIYQVDMRNHGRSPHTPTHHTTLMASDLESFVMTNPQLNTTPRDRTILVGHSMGGIATMHSLIRRANADYYGAGMVPSTAEEMEIRDSLADCDADERNINHYSTDPATGRQTERPFYGRAVADPSPSSSSSSAVLPPRVNGAIIVDIPPMQMGKEDRLGSVREIVRVMAGLDLSAIRTTKDGDAALKAAGIADVNMRMFLLTNMHFDTAHAHPHSATPPAPARWKCNIQTLHNDLAQIMIPDEDPNLAPGMRRVADVPVFFVFGSRSEYFKSLPRVEGLIDKYFDRASCPVSIEVMEGCDHYPHYQAPKRYVEVVAPFISEVFS